MQMGRQLEKSALGNMLILRSADVHMNEGNGSDRVHREVEEDTMDLDRVDSTFEDEEKIELPVAKFKSRPIPPPQSKLANSRQKTSQSQAQYSKDSVANVFEDISATPKPQSSWKPIPKTAYPQDTPPQPASNSSRSRRSSAAGTRRQSRGEENGVEVRRKSRSRSEIGASYDIEVDEAGGDAGEGQEDNRIPSVRAGATKQRKNKRVKSARIVHDDDDWEVAVNSRSGRDAHKSSVTNERVGSSILTGIPGTTEKLQREGETIQTRKEDMRKQLKIARESKLFNRRSKSQEHEEDRNAITMLNSSIKKKLPEHSSNSSRSYKKAHTRTSGTKAPSPITPTAFQRSQGLFRTSLNARSKLDFPRDSMPLDTHKSRAESFSAKQSSKEKPVKIVSQATLREIASMSPQVVIKSRPRPSLLSVVRTPVQSQRSDSTSNSPSEPDGEIVPKTQSAPKVAAKDTNPTVEAPSDSDSSASASEDEQPPKPSATALGKRKAIESPVIPPSAKRYMKARRNELEALRDDIRQFGRTATFSKSSTPTSSVPKREPLSSQHFTPQRILPPANLFRFLNSQGSARSTPTTSPHPFSSNGNAFQSTPTASSIKARPEVTAPRVSSIQRSLKDSMPATTAIAKAKAPVKAIRIARVPEVEFSKKVGGLKSSNAMTQPSSPKKTTFVRNESEDSSHSDEDVEDDNVPVGFDDEQVDDEMPSVSRTPQRGYANSSNKVSASDTYRDNGSPPRSSIRRKRRMPSFEHSTATSSLKQILAGSDAPKLKNNVIDSAFRNPAVAGTAMPSTSRANISQSIDSPAARELKLRSNSKLLAQGFDEDAIQIISEAMENFGRHKDLDSVALNNLVQQSTREGGEIATEMWNEIWSQVPDLDKKHVQQFCRRKYHNYILGPWSEEQDEELRFAFSRCPNKWTVISSMINRFPEHARLRYRDYIACGTTKKKDVWSLEEEDRLRAVYKDYIEKIREEKAKSQDSALLAASDESLIDWNAISVAMGRTRSRIQCFQKWLTIQYREADEDDVELAPMAETPWRVQKAVIKADTFTSEDKLRVLYALRECGAAAEDKIPWKTVAKDLDMQFDGRAMAMKVMFRNLRSCVRNHKQMKLQDVLSSIIEAFEAAAPGEPDGFDGIDQSVAQASQSENAAKASGKKSKNRAPRDITNVEGTFKNQHSTSSGPGSRPRLGHSNEGHKIDPSPSIKPKKMVRDRMRQADEEISQETNALRSEEDAEDIADELRLTWTQNSNLSKAKKPIFQPKLSQRNRYKAPVESSSEDDEEEQMSPSPPSIPENHDETVGDDANAMDLDSIEKSPPQTHPLEDDALSEPYDDTNEAEEDGFSRGVEGFLDIEATVSQDNSDDSDAYDANVTDGRFIEDDIASDSEHEGESVDDQIVSNEIDVESDHDAEGGQYYGHDTAEEDVEMTADEHALSPLQPSIDGLVQGQSEALQADYALDDDVSIKEEEVSDSENISSYLHTREVSGDDYSISDQVVNGKALSENLTESDRESPNLLPEPNGYHDYESDDEMEEEVPSVKYRSPSPPNYPSKTPSSASDEEDTTGQEDDEISLEENTHNSGHSVLPLLRLQQEDEIGVSNAAYSSYDIKSAQLMNGRSQESSLDTDSDSDKEEPPKLNFRSSTQRSPVFVNKPRAIIQQSSHHLNSSHRHQSLGPETSPSSSSSDEAEDDIIHNPAQVNHREDLESSITRDVTYPALPQPDETEDDETEDEDSDEAQLPPPPKREETGPWDYQRWVQERDANDDSDDDSDSDVSSIRADAPPKGPRLAKSESLEL